MKWERREDADNHYKRNHHSARINGGYYLWVYQLRGGDWVYTSTTPRGRHVTGHTPSMTASMRKAEEVAGIETSNQLELL